MSLEGSADRCTPHPPHSVMRVFSQQEVELRRPERRRQEEPSVCHLSRSLTASLLTVYISGGEELK